MKNFLKKIFIKLNIYKKNLFFRGIKFTEIYKSSLLKEIYIKGEKNFEPEMFKLIKIFNYNFFLDCGANIGIFSFFAKKNGIDTIAIEPLENNIKYIKKIQNINNINFKIIKKAISNKEEKRKIFIPIKKNEKYHAHSSLINSFKISNSAYVNEKYYEEEIETTSLNNIFKKNNLLSKNNLLIKIDIEGYELIALENIEEIICKNDNIDFIIEILIDDINKNKVFNFMTQRGYNAYLLTNYGFIKEERALTLPKYNQNYRFARTCWKNHFFTKKKNEAIKNKSLDEFNYFI